MKKSKWLQRLKVYLNIEVIVDYKACLYFFCVLFFYSMFLVLQGVYQASLLCMAEMIMTTYIMGYLQIFLFHNFDERDALGKKEVLAMLECVGIYTVVSWFLGWFDRQWTATFLFFVYMVIASLSVFLANKIKRMLDTENLNKMLTEFKKENGEYEK